MDSRIRRAQSCATDAVLAAREFHAAVAQPDMALVIFFCSSQYDLELETAEPQAGPDNSFAFLLVDGLSMREEPLTRALQSALGRLPLAGGSVVVMIDGTNYVRSIQKVNPDGSLTFFCAIEDGLVLRVAKGVDLLENLDQTFAQLQAEIGVPQLVLGCDCMLRKLEIVDTPLLDRVGAGWARSCAHADIHLAWHGSPMARVGQGRGHDKTVPTLHS